MAKKASNIKNGKRRRPIEPLEGHDEPIVVDNGPLRVDFGPSTKHRPDEEPNTKGRVWKRKANTLRHLLVLASTEPNHRIYVSHPLKLGDQVIVDVVPPGSSTVADTITFTRAALSPCVMTADETSFVEGMPSVLEPYNNADLRISSVTVDVGGTRTTVFSNPLTGSGELTWAKVSVVLVPR